MERFSLDKKWFYLRRMQFFLYWGWQIRSDGVGQERERVKDLEMQFILDSKEDCPVSKRDMNCRRKKDHIHVRCLQLSWNEMTLKVGERHLVWELKENVPSLGQLCFSVSASHPIAAPQTPLSSLSSRCRRIARRKSASGTGILDIDGWEVKVTYDR